MTNKVFLDIPKLGGVDTFRIIDKEEFAASDLRYVGSTWEGDGLDNPGEYDIYQDRKTDEYVAFQMP